VKKKSKKPRGGKISIFSFFPEARDELKKVTWPNRQQITKLTAIVIGASLVGGLYLGALDYIFVQIMGIIISN